MNILEIKMRRNNDAGADTIGEYIKSLFFVLWEEKEGFSGKRPFGNSDWEYEIFTALADAGAIEANFDGEYLNDFDEDAADKLIKEAIECFYPSKIKEKKS